MIWDFGFDLFFPCISSGHRIWDSGFQKLSFHLSLQGIGFGIRDLSNCLSIYLFRTQDSGFEIVFSYISSGHRIWDLGFDLFFPCISSGHRIWDLGFQKLSFRLSLQGRGFGIRDLSNCLSIHLFRTQDLGF